VSNRERVCSAGKPSKRPTELHAGSRSGKVTATEVLIPAVIV